MKMVRRMIAGIAALAFAFLGWWVALDNPQPVEVRLVGFDLPPLGLGLVLLIAFAAGALAGMAAGLPSLLRLKGTVRRLRRALAEAERP
ncbi:MAG: hypothetical protein KatS3mg124_1127 [Porticoccaceae bacterium]|nr:MAG: hypothetical protein KatS3mg124_1127 [Porticoccaceae bacterium]